MTDTSNNAPERIFIFPNSGEGGQWFLADPDDEDTEYIRKDIAEAKAQRATLDALAAGGQAEEAYTTQLKADAENERFRNLLSEAESDLRSQAEHDAPEDQRVYPSMQRRYNGDIDLPNRIRAALNQEGGEG